MPVSETVRAGNLTSGFKAHYSKYRLCSFNTLNERESKFPKTGKLSPDSSCPEIASTPWRPRDGRIV